MYNTIVVDRYLLVMKTLESDRLDDWQSSILMGSRTLEQHLDGLAALGAGSTFLQWKISQYRAINILKILNMKTRYRRVVGSYATTTTSRYI
jgi:hypothetical protein